MKLPEHLQNAINYIPANDGRDTLENEILRLLRENQELLEEMNRLNNEFNLTLKGHMK